MPICVTTQLEPFASFADSDAAKAMKIEARTLAPRPLLLISGSEDAVASETHVAEFVGSLSSTYARRKASGHLRHITLDGVGHNLDPKQVENTTAWLSEHFPAPRRALTG
jgi:predicted esterase